MSYLVKLEEEKVQKQLGDKGLKVDRKGKVVPELKIHELRAGTYNGMIRLLRLLCWTAQIIFPYLRTSFLTDFKTGWIACLKDQLIGTMLTTGLNFPYLPLPGTANRYCALSSFVLKV